MRNGEPAITLMPDNGQWAKHRCASLIWSTDQHTFLHVPKDCTQYDVEDGDQASLTAEEKAPEDERESITWNRLTFKHRHPSPPAICLVRHGHDPFVQGNFQASWASYLLSTVHRSPHSHQHPAQLAGDLPILLGLVAACAQSRTEAIRAIADWFPPSNNTSSWTTDSNVMRRAGLRKCIALTVLAASSMEADMIYFRDKRSRDGNTNLLRCFRS
jgi:hypothetical protein